MVSESSFRTNHKDSESSCQIMNSPKLRRIKELLALRFFRASAAGDATEDLWMDVLGLSRELIPCEPLADDLAYGDIEALTVIQSGAMVVAERLLIKVSEQVEGLHRNIGALQTAFQKAPEILHPVSVNVAAHVLDSVVYHFMLKLVQPLVGLKSISEDRGARKNMLSQFGLKGLLLGIVHNLYANLAVPLAAALQNAHDRNFIFPASAGDFLGANVSMHVARLATDVGFVRFDLAGQFIDTPHRQGVPNAVIHEPRGLLGNSDGAVNLVGTDSIFAVHNLPHGHEPFVQAERRVFKDGPGLCGELAVFVARAALPAIVLLKERNALGAATRAFNAIRPAPRYNVFAAVDRIGEVDDGFLKSVEYRLHETIVACLL